MKGILVLLTVLTLSMGFTIFNALKTINIDTVEKTTEGVYTNY